MTVEAPPQPKVLREIVPQEFHDRPYLKDLLDKPQDPATFGEVFKKLDGAEKLVGKKVGIPEADAKPEDWDSFFSKLRPEKEDDYTVKSAEGATPDPEFVKVLKSAFHGAGISKVQAERFQVKMLAALEARSKAAVAEQAKSNAEFETLSKAALGPENAKVIERVKGALNEHTPDVLKPYVGKLDNNSLVIMAGVIDAIMKKYVPEDKLNPGGGKGSEDTGNLREEGRKLMALPAYRDEFHPDHEKVKAQVAALYAQFKK